MKIKILTIFPEMFDSFLATSIIKKAIKQNLVNIEVINIRDYSEGKHKNTDDVIYGGGVGMLMDFVNLSNAIIANSNINTYRIFTSPRGRVFNQDKALELSKSLEIMIICGHYEGIDERVYNFIDEDISLGDFVLTGGELASMVITDAIVRLIPNVVKGCNTDSFSNSLLEEPQYTKPKDYLGFSVPEVLLSGNNKLINAYRLKESIRTTFLYRPDLFSKHHFTKEEHLYLLEVIFDYIKKLGDSYEREEN